MNVYINTDNIRERMQVGLLAALVIVGGLAIGHGDTTLAPMAVVRCVPLLNYCLLGCLLLFINWQQGLTYAVMGKLGLAVAWFLFTNFDVIPGFKNSGFLLFLMMAAFAFCEDPVLVKAMRLYRKWIVAVAVVGIVACLDFFVLHLLPHTMVPYYSQDGASMYANYWLSYIIWYGGISFRLCGTFNEPGIFGTVMALMLVLDRFDMRKWQNVVLLIACCLTFSVASFTLIIIGGIMYSLKNLKFMMAAIVFAFMGGQFCRSRTTKMSTVCSTGLSMTPARAN